MGALKEGESRSTQEKIEKSVLEKREVKVHYDF
jgi:hypothetical protein